MRYSIHIFTVSGRKVEGIADEDVKDDLLGKLESLYTAGSEPPVALIVPLGEAHEEVVLTRYIEGWRVTSLGEDR